MIKRFYSAGHLALRPFAVLPFFLFLLFADYAVSYFEQTLRCFPVTVVTTDKKIVERLAAVPDRCMFSVETEKFMIESQIFNDYDVPPVKDIYLIMLKTAYTQWDEIREIDNAITEMNPFVKRAADFYIANGLKLKLGVFLAALVVLLLCTPVAAVALPKGRRIRIASGLWLLGSYGAAGFWLFFNAAAGSKNMLIFSLSAGFVMYIIMEVIVTKHADDAAGGL